MEKLIKEIGRTFEIHEKNKEIDYEELIAKKFWAVYKTARDFLLTLEIFQRKLQNEDNKTLFPEMLDKLIKKCWETGPLAHEDFLIPKNERLIILDIIANFLGPDEYQTPVISSEENDVVRNLGNHIISLLWAYNSLFINFQKNKKFSITALHYLDIAAMKLLPLASIVAVSAKESKPIKHRDRHIKKGRKITKTNKKKPERKAFVRALRELVTENDLFVQLSTGTKLMNIRSRMVKNGFPNEKLKVMREGNRSGTQEKWLKEELAKNHTS